MSRHGLWRELSIALGLSIGGAIMFRCGAWVLGTGLAFRLTLATIGAGYALALLTVMPSRVGRLATLLLFVALDLALFLLHAPLTLWGGGQAFLLWLLRCSYLHKNITTAMLDLGLAGLAVGMAQVGFLHNGSTFLALWSYGLIQALHTLLPRFTATTVSPMVDADRFDTAYHQAEAALRRLT